MSTKSISIIEADRVQVAVLANNMCIIARVGHDMSWEDPAVPQIQQSMGEGGVQYNVTFSPMLAFFNENSIPAPHVGDTIATVKVGSADEEIRRLYLQWRKTITAARAGLILPG
jgi:hypothetical protein